MLFLTTETNATCFCSNESDDFYVSYLQKLKLCPAASGVSIVKDKCIWGETFWCKSYENAKLCNVSEEIIVGIGLPVGDKLKRKSDGAILTKKPPPPD